MKVPSPARIELLPNERILAVVPEYAAGPGWSNAPIWVYIGKPDGTMRSYCIQPNERTPELHTLFAAGAAMHASLVKALHIRRKPVTAIPAESR